MIFCASNCESAGLEVWFADGRVCQVAERSWGRASIWRCRGAGDENSIRQHGGWKLEDVPIARVEIDWDDLKF